MPAIEPTNGRRQLDVWRGHTRLVAMLVPLLVAAAGACRRDPRAEPTWSDDDRSFYALGTVVARRAKHFAPTSSELPIVKRAIADSIRGLPLLVSLNAEEDRLQKLVDLRRPMVAVADRLEGERTLARAARQPNAVTTATGIVRASLSPGTGPSPGPNDKVRVRHEGRLTNGALITRRKPEIMNVAACMPCLRETLPTMKVGEVVRLTCPASKAYGESGMPPRVPGNAVIVSTVELLEVLPPETASSPAGTGGAP